jgi:hypothetical protein
MRQALTVYDMESLDRITEAISRITLYVRTFTHPSEACCLLSSPFNCRRRAARVRVGVGNRLSFLDHFFKIIPTGWHTSTSSEGLGTFEVATSFASDLW